MPSFKDTDLVPDLLDDALHSNVLQPAEEARLQDSAQKEQNKLVDLYWTLLIHSFLFCVGKCLWGERSDTRKMKSGSLCNIF